MPWPLPLAIRHARTAARLVTDALPSRRNPGGWWAYFNMRSYPGNPLVYSARVISCRRRARPPSSRASLRRGAAGRGVAGGEGVGELHDARRLLRDGIVDEHAVHR